MADTVPVSGLPELRAHLQALVDDAALPMDAKLLDQVEIQLTDDNIPPLLPVLLPPLTQILKSTAQDPTPLLSLAVKLLGPLSLAQALAIADPPTLLAALRSPLPGANLVALAVVHKAAASPADADALAALPDVVEEVVRRWLGSPDVGVGERAIRVLGDVLEADCEAVAGPALNGVGATDLVRRRLPGHGRVWRLVFQGRPCLPLIHRLCTPDQDLSRSMRAVTISQGRLLRLLPRLVALDIRPLSHTSIPDLFRLPEAVDRQVGRGILQWAALGMVDKSDVLMRLNLVDFFEALVSITCVSGAVPDNDGTLKSLLRAAVRDDAALGTALRTLPDRTVEEEAEALRRYVVEILD